MKNKTVIFGAGIFLTMMIALSSVCSSTTIFYDQEMTSQELELDARAENRELISETPEYIPWIPYGGVWEENPSFPSELPDGVSSLSAVVGRYTFNFWTMQVYSVGYAVKVMRLRDGENHSWEFNGNVETTYAFAPTNHRTVQRIDTWSGTHWGGFDLVTEDTDYETSFDTKHVQGTISKDIGGDSSKDRTFYGSQHEWGGGASYVYTFEEAVQAIATGELIRVN